MGIPGSANPMLFGGAAAYQINQSLRFNSADSTYLSRTISTAATGSSGTVSLWVKRTNFSQRQCFISGATSNGLGNGHYAQFWEPPYDGIDLHIIGTYDGGSQTVAKYRDPSAWYHIVIQFDSTQSGATNQCIYYVNGVSQSDRSVSGNWADRAWGITTNGSLVQLGAYGNPGQYGKFDGYLAEVHVIDGSLQAPSSFGETDTITGAWIPKKYSGSYGTNGFYLKFDPSATNGIGHDHSGNGNNFTATGFSTSGTGTDVMSDTPTNNYCTWNPLRIGGSTTTPFIFSEGNLKLTHNSTVQWQFTQGTIPVSSGKWYYEFTVVTRPTNVHQNYTFGFYEANVFNGGYYKLAGNLTFNVDTNSPFVCLDTTQTSYGSIAGSDGDTYMVALDVDSQKFWVGLNGTWMASGNPGTGANPSLSSIGQRTWVPHVSSYAYGSPLGVFEANFGQRSFSYTPPSGFKALNTANLPEPTIKKGGAHFNTVLYTGDSAASHAITGVGFQPDFLWIKRRNGAQDHQAFDAVRGADKSLQQNATNAESDNDTQSSFDADGFTLTGAGVATNSSGGTFVAWNWKANGAGSSNTAGTITSTVSANATAGFSIVTYTGNGSTATVGHGLGVAPRLVIVKKRAGGTMGGGYSDWLVYSQAAVDAGAGSDAFYYLNSTAATSNSSSVFSGAPSSTVINIGNNQIINNSGSTFVAYCFSEVAGYSKFGRYTGNGSSDGPFVFCGFRPRYVFYKRTDSSASWFVYDTSRSPYNYANQEIIIDSAGAEFTDQGVDFLSNGFKIRAPGNYLDRNASGGTYIFAAFAELPFKYSNAR